MTATNQSFDQKTLSGKRRWRSVLDPEAKEHTETGPHPETVETAEAPSPDTGDDDTGETKDAPHPYAMYMGAAP